MAIIDSTSQSGTTLACAASRPKMSAVEDDAGGRDHAGLEAAARTEVAVKLHVQREQQDERDEKLGDHPQDQVVAHRAFLPRCAAGAAAR